MDWFLQSPGSSALCSIIYVIFISNLTAMLQPLDKKQKLEQGSVFTLQHPFRLLLELYNCSISGEFLQQGGKSARLLPEFVCEGHTCSQHRIWTGCSSCFLCDSNETGARLIYLGWKTTRWEPEEKQWICSDMHLWQWTSVMLLDFNRKNQGETSELKKRAISVWIPDTCQSFIFFECVCVYSPACSCSGEKLL